jgi:hypothetical protein
MFKSLGSVESHKIIRAKSHKVVPVHSLHSIILGFPPKVVPLEAVFTVTKWLSSPILQWGQGLPPPPYYDLDGPTLVATLLYSYETYSDP